MEWKWICPFCNSTAVLRQRHINGFTNCKNCGVSLPHKEWDEALEKSQANYESEQIAKARKLIADHLNADEGFRLGYEANIAMLLYDQYGIKDEKKRNQAAKDLLKLIFE